MRIGCISTSSVPSRTANSMEVMKVCQAFKAIGHEVRLWVPDSQSNQTWPQIQEHYGLREDFAVTWVASAGWLRRYDFSYRAVRAAIRWKADCLYVWPFQAAALASRLGQPTLLELHDRPPGRSGPFLFRQFLQGSGARKLLPITQALLDWVNQEYSLDMGLPFAVVSPSGVDLNQYAALPSPSQARKVWDLPERVTAGYTGHLYPGRGMDFMLELADNTPEVGFIWVGGEESTRAYWERLVKERGIPNLRLMGHVPNQQLPSIQAACEFLLMPYESKVSVSSGGDTSQFASPMKMFEYLACGRAILASDLPVLGEVLNAQNSRVLPMSDPKAWIETIKELLSNVSLREELGVQAKKDSLRYSWDTRARKSLQDLENRHAA